MRHRYAGLFRNPLALPGIIGVSSGASLGAALAIVLLSDVVSSLPWVNSLVLPIAALIGGALTTVFVYRLGISKFGTSVKIMLLAGVAISALAGQVLVILIISRPIKCCAT